MFDWLANVFLNHERYRTNSEAVIVACFFNPQMSPYRLVAFQKWYRSIRHLHHRIIECLIGEDGKSQLPESEFITQVHADTLLWHKETLLNKVIADLPDEYRYVFWLDTDVLFTNLDWLPESVEALETADIVQPFEYCIHLEKNQLKPSFDVEKYRKTVSDPKLRHPMMWRSFCANAANGLIRDPDYDRHGHVGFAWGAKRELLDACPLYDRALIGGADHIIAHAAAHQIPHDCITKSFTDNIEDVEAWSREFSKHVDGLGYAKGDLYHIWHGDIAQRQYLQRIKDFTPGTRNLQKDKHGFYTMPKRNQEYMRKYYRHREVVQIEERGFYGMDEGFFDDMGYAIADIVNLFGQPQYDDYEPPVSIPIQGQQPDVLPFERPVQGSVAPEIYSPTFEQRGDDPVPELVPQEISKADTIPFDPEPAQAHSGNFS